MVNVFRVVHDLLLPNRPQAIVPANRLPPPLPREPGDNLPPMICRAAFEELCVLANGDIVCSCGDPTGLRVYGNVFVDRIASVYNGPMYQEIRQWQLRSKPDSWCPVIGERCSGRVARASAVDRVDGRTVKLLQLEPVTYCNVRCPACPVTTHFTKPNARARKDQVLPLNVMLDVIDQLPDLETLLFYNFGEPFLHADATRFLRELRRRRPSVYIATNTNGLVLTTAQIEALASEALLDKIVFSIDGADAASYRKYRVGGDLQQALRNLDALEKACARAGTRGRMEIIWQYILFEWNDSQEEIARAKEMAQRIGVPVMWVLTHTRGASKRITADTVEWSRLAEGEASRTFLTCELQLAELWRNGGIVKGRYLARISAPQSVISAPAGAKVPLKVTVQNLASEPWAKAVPYAFHLGVMLRSPTGRRIRELPGVPLPLEATRPGGEGAALIELSLPNAPGQYQLLIDVVENGICWFFERGSSPLVCTVNLT